jgi:hypothetical protein
MQLFLSKNNDFVQNVLVVQRFSTPVCHHFSRQNDVLLDIIVSCGLSNEN